MPNLDEIKARRGKIMQGECLKHIAVPRYVDKSFPNHEVTDFIANAPADIDWLVGEVERLREEKKRLIADFAKSDQFIVVQLGYALGWHKDVDLELARKEIGVETMDDYLFCVAGDHTAETMAMAVRDKVEEHHHD